MASISARLQMFQDDPSTLIDPHIVHAACEACKHRWRHRVLDPVHTLQVFAAQMACGNTAIAHAVRMFDGEFTASGYCQARSRLPVSMLEALLKHSARKHPAAATEPLRGDGPWHGHRVALIDGSGASVPDTPELRAHLGVPSGCAQGCGLPLAKTLLLFDAHDGRLLDMHVSPAMTGDLRHARDVHPALAAGDVLVGDRGLCSYTHLAALTQHGCHGVFRMAMSRRVPFPARAEPDTSSPGGGRHRTQEPILVEMVSDDDQIIEIARPRNRPPHITAEEYATFPPTLRVRAIRYTTKGPTIRTHEITLLTTLTDARKYSAEALAQLYLMRWRVEVNIRHLKRTLGMDRLKCKSIDGVKRELLMFGIIYNAVCRVRSVAAAAAGVEPVRLSFIDTLRHMLTTDPWIDLNPPTKHPIKQWPIRPSRLEPRQLKRRHNDFRVMTLPRTRLRELVAARTNKP